MFLRNIKVEKDPPTLEEIHKWDYTDGFYHKVLTLQVDSCYVFSHEMSELYIYLGDFIDTKLPSGPDSFEIEVENISLLDFNPDTWEFIVSAEIVIYDPKPGDEDL